MTEEDTKLDSDEFEEREQITVSIPLDAAHQRLDLALRKELKSERISAEDIISQQIIPPAEQALYETVQNMKYTEE